MVAIAPNIKQTPCHRFRRGAGLVLTEGRWRSGLLLLRILQPQDYRKPTLILGGQTIFYIKTTWEFPRKIYPCGLAPISSPRPFRDPDEAPCSRPHLSRLKPTELLALGTEGLNLI